MSIIKLQIPKSTDTNEVNKWRIWLQTSIMELQDLLETAQGAITTLDTLTSIFEIDSNGNLLVKLDSSKWFKFSKTDDPVTLYVSIDGGLNWSKVSEV